MSLRRPPPIPPFLPVAGDWLNLTAFCGEFKRVLMYESAGCPIDIPLQPLFQSLLVPDDTPLVRTQGADTLVHLLLMFNHYADWAVAVGVALGLEDQDAEMADNWVAGLPNTSRYLKSLSRDVSRCITHLSQQHQRDQGYNLAAVYVDAIRRDESPDQTRIRHLHTSRGLKQIKGTHDDNA